MNEPDPSQKNLNIKIDPQNFKKDDHLETSEAVDRLPSPPAEALPSRTATAVTVGVSPSLSVMSGETMQKLHHTHRYRLRLVRILEIILAAILLALFVAVPSTSPPTTTTNTNGLLQSLQAQAWSIPFCSGVHVMAIVVAVWLLLAEQVMDSDRFMLIGAPTAAASAGSRQQHDLPRPWAETSQDELIPIEEEPIESSVQNPNIQNQIDPQRHRELEEFDLPPPPQLLPTPPSASMSRPSALGSARVQQSSLLVDENLRQLIRRKSRALVLAAASTFIQILLNFIATLSFFMTVSCLASSTSVGSSLSLEQEVACRAWTNTVKAVTWVELLVWLLSLSFCLDRYDQWQWLHEALLPPKPKQEESRGPMRV